MDSVETTGVAVTPGEISGTIDMSAFVFVVDEKIFKKVWGNGSGPLRKGCNNPDMIGIIGFGRFGKLMAGYLSKDFNVKVYNRSDKHAEIEAAGAVSVSLAEVCRQKVVILSVPISTMQVMLKKIAPMLRKGCRRSRCLLGQGLPGTVDAGYPARIGIHSGHPSHVRPGQRRSVSS